MIMKHPCLVFTERHCGSVVDAELSLTPHASILSSVRRKALTAEWEGAIEKRKERMSGTIERRLIDGEKEND